jgi:hypothetical protein
MTLGSSLVAIVAGVILKFAVTARVAGISIPTVGVILMAVGAIGLIIGLSTILTDRASGRPESRIRRKSGDSLTVLSCACRTECRNRPAAQWAATFRSGRGAPVARWCA